MTPNPSIERTSQRPLRALCAAAHVQRWATQSAEVARRDAKRITMIHLVWAIRSFALCVGALSTPLSWAVANAELATLRKVATVTTTVSVLTAAATRYYVSQSQVRAKLDSLLRSGGLRVLSEAEAANERSTHPFVRLQVPHFPVTASNGQTIGYVYSVELSVRLASRVPLNRASAPVELWQTSQVGFSPPEELSSSIEAIVEQFVDRLLEQWRTDNQ